MNIRQTILSGFLIGSLGLQAFVIFGPDLPNDGGYFWPFVSYPMYNAAHFQGERINQYRLVGVTAKGEKEITPYDLGMGTNYFVFRRGAIRAMVEDNRAAMRKYARVFESRTRQSVRLFRLENRPLVLTRRGPQPGALEVRRIRI